LSCDIKLDDTLDRTLEDGAKQHNLTVVNVRNILHVSAEGPGQGAERCSPDVGVVLMVALSFMDEGLVGTRFLTSPVKSCEEGIGGCA